MTLQRPQRVPPYASFHAFRKPPSIVESVLGPSATSVDDGWAPFNGDKGTQRLCELDLAFLSSYAIGMYFVGHLGDRIDLRYFLVFVYLMALCCLCCWECVWNSHTSVGNIVGSVIASSVLDFGWGLSFALPGVVVIVSGLLVFCCLVVTPNDLGFEEPGKEIEMAIGFLEAWRLPGVTPFAFCLFFSKLVVYTFLYWLPYYLRHQVSLGKRGEYLQDYQPLIDRVIARISSWPVKRLSFAGRLQLIQSVLSSIINFWAAVFPLPARCIERLEQICNAFLWSGAPNSARGAKISWDSVCSSKASGGLGLRRLSGLSQLFGLKLIWLIFAGNGSLWVAWVKRHLIGERLFWTADFSQSGSWLWKKLMKFRNLARPFLSSQVRSGSSTLFWHDDWTGLGPLIDISGANGPRVCGIRSMAVVAQAVSNGNWKIPNGRHPILVLMRSCLPASVPDVSSLLSDIYLWRNTADSPPEIFSSSKMWNTLHPSPPPLGWTKTVWFKRRIPKHAFILWIALRNRLTTRDKLISWGMVVPSHCLLCGIGQETRDHIFFQCPYSSQVWNRFFQHRSLSPPISFEDIALWIQSASPNKKVKVI
ncbi:unnamed protein product [Microthlaspi erraticum]|uniref:Reverse transcriptase zinc-binding domain-containing protein n=1 Tax=Microthlaspi erraticum TaxID=1685480 RepID=A0A6D2IE48_9BRAS|nr:unnamed protein product [Microthlaspi erraticum]